MIGAESFPDHRLHRPPLQSAESERGHSDAPSSVSRPRERTEARVHPASPFTARLKYDRKVQSPEAGGKTREERRDITPQTNQSLSLLLSSLAHTTVSFQSLPSITQSHDTGHSRTEGPSSSSSFRKRATASLDVRVSRSGTGEKLPHAAPLCLRLL